MSNFNAAEYWEGRLRGNVALEKIGYLGLGRHYNEWLYRVRESVFRRTVKSLGVDLSASSVMDVGSGSGFYVRLWKELGARQITGLDLTSAAVEHLRGRFPDTPFYKADITEATLPVCGPQFDIISAFDVLFHIVDDARYRSAIANIHSLLRPGGLFLLSDVFVHGKVSRSEHFVSRPLAEAEQVLRESGFQMLRRQPVFVLMANPVDSPSRIRRLMWGAFQRVVSRSELAGFLAGAALCPVEILLSSMIREGCSTEIMICKKAVPAQKARPSPGPSP